MKDVPFLFQAPMVRALLDGSKTQTRRIAKPRNSLINGKPPTADQWAALDWEHATPLDRMHGGPAFVVPVVGGVFVVEPRVEVGDQVWAREAFRVVHGLDPWPEGGVVVYAADVDGAELERESWKPGIHLKRTQARIFRHVTDVRAVTLAPISNEDAAAEGVAELAPGRRWRDYTDPDSFMVSPAQSFRSLWRSINGEGHADWTPLWAYTIETAADVAARIQRAANEEWARRIGETETSGFQVEPIAGERFYLSTLYGGRRVSGTSFEVLAACFAYIESRAPKGKRSDPGRTREKAEQNEHGSTEGQDVHERDREEAHEAGDRRAGPAARGGARARRRAARGVR